jgi:hypothetical protein
MTLFVVGETQTPVTTTPHRLLLNGWKARLEATELRAIEAELNHLVSTKQGNEISTARWLPCEISPLGHHDWHGSAFMKIWDKVGERDRARTCWCFAVFLFEHMMRRGDAWHFKTFDLDDVPMAGTRYYRWPVRDQPYAKPYGSMVGAATSIV